MKINAVKLQRALRKRISRETMDMSPAEEIAYYQKGARAFQAWMTQAERNRAAYPPAPRQGRADASSEAAEPRRRTTGNA